MRIAWRIFLLAALHFGVLVAYPEYTAFAPITVFIIFLISCAAVIAATTLMSIVGLGKYVVMNFIFDVVMVIIVGALLLMFTPQASGVRPFDRVVKGQYPTKSDIDRGLAKFGLKSVDHIKSGLDSAAGKIGDGLSDAKNVVVKEIRE